MVTIFVTKLGVVCYSNKDLSEFVFDFSAF